MNNVYFTVVFKADSLSEEERSSLVEKCSVASWSHAIDERKALEAEVGRLTDTNKQFGKIIHNQVVANQAAWIEWQRGKGAEAAMAWVHNGLWDPGQIPDESEPWVNDPQAYYDANNADPFPACYCGRPSSQLWMGHGACCHEHMQEIQQKEQAKEAQQ